jgi:hypothetical protein
MTPAMPEPAGGWRNRRARRRAERAFARDLETESRQRAATQTAADRDAGRIQDPLSWAMRIVVGLVGGFVLAVAAVIALVVVAAQIGFYQAHLTTKTIDLAGLGIQHRLDLPTFTPLATEGLVWATTLLAVVMVVLNRTAGLWTRSMWTFASIAATVNTWYSINDERDLFGGALRGGLSLAGPFLVHLFILWCRHLRTGRTLAQARVEFAVRWSTIGRIVLAVLISIGAHIRHPRIAGNALGYYLGIQQWSYRDAWNAASLEYRMKVQGLIEAAGKRPERAAGSASVAAAETAVEDGPEAAARDEAQRPIPAPTSRPAWTQQEADELAAKLADPNLTADLFSTGPDQLRPSRDPAARPSSTGGRQAAGTDPRPRPNPTGKAARPRTAKRPTRLLAAADVDVSDLLPAAREVAAELATAGRALNRDNLLAGLRRRKLTVGGRRRTAIYNAILNEQKG